VDLINQVFSLKDSHLPKNDSISINKEQISTEKEESMAKNPLSFGQLIQVLNEPFEKLIRSDRMDKLRQELRDVYTMKLNTILLCIFILADLILFFMLKKKYGRAGRYGR
jgi:hypothetical protein